MSESNPYHGLYFPKFTIRSSLAPGRPLLADQGMSSVYAELIDEYWRPKAASEIVDVLTRRQAEDREQDWTVLGTQLVRDLLTCGTHVGLSFNGQLGLDTELAWLPQFYRGGPGIVDLKVTHTQHPTRSWFSKNMTWNSLQAIDDQSWLVSLWASAKSMWFNHGCDLLLSIYNADVASAIKWDEPLTIAAFGRTLARAVGWMIPIDGNMGFVVGMPHESTLYANLSAELPLPPPIIP
jgi:hypothetical protein